MKVGNTALPAVGNCPQRTSGMDFVTVSWTRCFMTNSPRLSWLPQSTLPTPGLEADTALKSTPLSKGQDGWGHTICVIKEVGSSNCVGPQSCGFWLAASWQPSQSLRERERLTRHSAHSVWLTSCRQTLGQDTFWIFVKEVDCEKKVHLFSHTNANVCWHH